MVGKVLVWIDRLNYYILSRPVALLDLSWFTVLDTNSLVIEPKVKELWQAAMTLTGFSDSYKKHSATLFPILTKNRLNPSAIDFDWLTIDFAVIDIPQTVVDLFVENKVIVQKSLKTWGKRQAKHSRIRLWMYSRPWWFIRRGEYFTESIPKHWKRISAIQVL